MIVKGIIMTTFKRISAVSLVVILISLVFAGCAKDGSNEPVLNDNDFSQRVSDTINAYLDKNDEKVALNSGVGGWEISGSELKDVLDKENIDAKNLDEYKDKMIYATIFAVEKKDKSTADTLFVTDKEGKTIIFSAILKDGMTPKIYNELNKEF